MKTLEEHTLLYDIDCPLCNLYTSSFIKSRMLDENGRKPFNKLANSSQTYIDLNRATNEIALVDTKNKTVLYGIDSLLKVIGHSFPIIEKIGHLKPAKFLLKKLYSFVSYNRKVIIPSKKKIHELECVPTFNIKYRILYIVFAVLITGMTLISFIKSMPQLASDSIYKALIIVLGQLMFQALFLMKKEKETRINYLGNLMTISLIGSLLLVALIILNTITPLANSVNIIGFGIIALLMLLEHIRRLKILELPSFLTIPWVLYNIIVLIFILSN